METKADPVDIFTMTPLDCCLGFAGFHTAFSRRCAEEAWQCGMLFGAKAGGKHAGYLCAVRENVGTRITFAYTVPSCRRQGIFTALVREVLRCSQGTVRISVLADQECCGIVSGLCERFGFVRGDRSVVYSCGRENIVRWQAFMEEKGRRICGMLQRHGYAAVSLAGADEELLRQIAESDRSDYRNGFSPAGYFAPGSGRLSRELSFAAVKDGVLAAYCLVTKEGGEAVIFEQISAAAGKQGTGVVFLPFAASVERVIQSGCSRAFFAMYERNEAANDFRRKALDGFVFTERITENYYHIPASGVFMV